MYIIMNLLTRASINLVRKKLNGGKICYTFLILIDVFLSVEGGASVAAVHDLHISLLCQCAANGNLEELTRLVVDKKLDANSALKDGTTALHNAAQYGHLGTVVSILNCCNTVTVVDLGILVLQ